MAYEEDASPRGRVRHLFGPVPSRRLGISLGIDIVPHKTCTLNCIYCECGETTRLRIRRRRFMDPAGVLAELDRVLAREPQIDYLTFSGAGEPTLNRDIGFLIAEIKRRTTLPVAVLSNGTLFYRPEVRREILPADLVLPSLDAVSRDVFSRINRPHPALDVARHVAGLKAFRREYSGRIWLEILFVKGVNDHPDELRRLHDHILDIRPDKVQLNSLDRPPAIAGVEPVDLKGLERIRRGWPDLPVEIVKRARARREIASFSKDLESDILNTIARRPLTVEDLVRLTGKNRLEVLKYIDVLEKERKISMKIVGREIFFAPRG